VRAVVVYALEPHSNTCVQPCVQSECVCACVCAACLLACVCQIHPMELGKTLMNSFLFNLACVAEGSGHTGGGGRPLPVTLTTPTPAFTLACVQPRAVPLPWCHSQCLRGMTPSRLGCSAPALPPTLRAGRAALLYHSHSRPSPFDALPRVRAGAVVCCRLIMLCVLPVVQFCTQAFNTYAR
jgi:hypothetical protein